VAVCGPFACGRVSRAPETDRQVDVEMPGSAPGRAPRQAVAAAGSRTATRRPFHQPPRTDPSALSTPLALLLHPDPRRVLGAQATTARGRNRTTSSPRRDRDVLLAVGGGGEQHAARASATSTSARARVSGAAIDSGRFQTSPLARSARPGQRSLPCRRSPPGMTATAGEPGGHGPNQRRIAFGRRDRQAPRHGCSGECSALHRAQDRRGVHLPAVGRAAPSRSNVGSRRGQRAGCPDGGHGVDELEPTLRR
jgi:hypothetical protein